MPGKDEENKIKALKLDDADPLKNFRKLFTHGDKSLIYFDGNSLGMMPVETEKVLREVVSREWGERLIRGWNENWWEMPRRCAAAIAPLVGARADEIAVCDSTSVNLYKLVMATLKMRPGRRRIVSDEMNFPSDLYILQGIADQAGQGYELVLARSREMVEVPLEELEKVIDTNTAVVVLTYVSFRSSYMYDMLRVTELAHRNGALVIWDLCHAAGAVSVELGNCGADMAVGCTYKYLNGGPGSPSFLYVRRDLQPEVISPIWGWIGEKDPFEFSLQYRPATGIRQTMTGSPSILSMSTLEPSLRIVSEAGINRIREKSIAMTEFMIELFHDILAPEGFTLGSPLNSSERGSHISIRHREGYRICKALIDEKEGGMVIIPDFRPPDNIRLGLAPLYNTFSEINDVVNEIGRIVKERVFEKYDPEIRGVT